MNPGVCGGPEVFGFLPIEWFFVLLGSSYIPGDDLNTEFEDLYGEQRMQKEAMGQVNLFASSMRWNGEYVCVEQESFKRL